MVSCWEINTSILKIRTFADRFCIRMLYTYSINICLFHTIGFLVKELSISSEVPIGKEKKALYIRDNVGHVDTIRKALEENGFELLVSEIGQEAIVISKQSKLDLIIVDIQPPKMEGLEVIRQLRSSGLDKLEQLPVFGITGERFPGHLSQEVLSAGVNEILGSSMDANGIHSRIADLVY